MRRTAGSVPAIRHRETVAHKIAGCVQHVVEQFRGMRTQVFRHLVVGRLQPPGNRLPRCLRHGIADGRIV